ncbi:MAG: hypothetical protein ABR867_01655 [Nitrososphaerales archaeon]
MKPLSKFALILLAGIGVLVTGSEIYSIETLNLVSQAIKNPRAWLPACTYGYTSGCVIWPYVSVGLIVLGLLMTLAGIIGIVETWFPRGDVSFD